MQRCPGPAPPRCRLAQRPPLDPLHRLGAISPRIPATTHGSPLSAQRTNIPANVSLLTARWPRHAPKRACHRRPAPAALRARPAAALLPGAARRAAPAAAAGRAAVRGLRRQPPGSCMGGVAPRWNQHHWQRLGRPLACHTDTRPLLQPPAAARASPPSPSPSAHVSIRPSAGPPVQCLHRLHTTPAPPPDTRPPLPPRHTARRRPLRPLPRPLRRPPIAPSALTSRRRRRRRPHLPTLPWTPA
jgi:hypothetical protein